MISSVVRTVLVYLAVVVAMRLMGKRLQRRIHLHRRAGSTALGQPGADFLNHGS